MWSGPRNLSTAMMYAFAARGDCAVQDEPFYGAYLKMTGIDHPMREEILQHHESDWREVDRAIAGPPPGGRNIWYQKHMTHHMLPEIGRGFMRSCKHAFLIRHPARVLASYAAKRETVSLRDIGFVEQEALFDEAAALSAKAPPVIDADMMGRAYPEAQMTSVAGADLKPCPLTTVDVRGLESIVDQVPTWKWMERVSRKICVEYGSIASTCKAPRTGAEIKRWGIHGTTTKAIAIALRSLWPKARP